MKGLYKQAEYKKARCLPRFGLKSEIVAIKLIAGEHGAIGAGPLKAF